MRPLSHAQIEAIREEKRTLEVDVARTIYRHFQLHHKYAIQRLVREMVMHMLSARNQTKLNQLLSGKRGQFLMFQRGVDPSISGLRESLKREAFWSLELCSDMIRLFGETNEKWNELGLSDEHAKGQSALRPEPTFLKVGASNGVKEGGWGKEMGHRDRKDIDEADQGRRGAPYTNIGSIVRGVDKFQILPKSVVGAIDRTFGLRPEGGDVSGTTTDSIYALRWAGKVAGGPVDTIKAIQILPMITMVPQGHHSIVECAYPLSRHGYIDYHIGYYGTLAPVDSPGLYDRLLAHLDLPDRNKHILVWGRGAGERGVQIEGPQEMEAFKRLARVLSAYGFCVAGGLNDFTQALNVMRTFSPDLLAPRLQAFQGDLGLSELERQFRRFGLR